MESPATVISASAVGSAGGGGGSAHGYPDSVDSSPRSRGGGGGGGADSWDEFASSTGAFGTANTAGRLRLMCSYGGRIMPRPTDRSLCYLGGETRIVVVDRHATLVELMAKLSRSLLSGRTFTLKYQLPNEDLDSLISVATDEDLENMIDEYDRLLSSSGGGSNGGATAAGGGTGGGGGSTRSGRLRLFLFPSKTESAPPSSIGSLLDDSKTETWFVDALNSAMAGMEIEGLPRGHSTDSASVNCLLGLEDDSVHSRGGATISVGGGGRNSEPEQLVIPHPHSSGRPGRQGQDVHSVPGSPMLDTTSPFGSASSVPSLSNLPPIRVRADERPPDHPITGVDDHFVQMNISSSGAVAAASTGHMLDEAVYPPQRNQHPTPSISLSAAATTVPIISPTENPSRVFSFDGEKLLPQPPRAIQMDTATIGSTIIDSSTRSMYSNVNSDPKGEFPVSDSVSRVQMPVVTNSFGYQQQEQLLQQQQLHPHLHHQQQQQYIPANAQYIHHTGTGAVLPVPPYYPVAGHTIQQPQQVHRPYGQQIPMYYLPQSPYTLAPVQQPVGNPGSVTTAVNPAVPTTRVPPKPELPTNLYNTPGAPPPVALQPPLIHVGADQARPYAATGYHFLQQHHLSQSTATMPNYSYEFAADYAHPQVNFSQVATSPPALTAQYQTVSSSGPVAAEAKAQGDNKTTRAS